MKMIEQRLDTSLFSEGFHFSSISSLSDTCEISTLKQTSSSEALLDIAWLLKHPLSETFWQIMTASKIQRFNCLLNFLIAMESTTIIEKVLLNLETMMNNMKSDNGYNGSRDADLRLLEKYMGYAHEILHQKKDEARGTEQHSKTLMPKEDFASRSSFQYDLHSVSSQVKTSPFFFLQSKLS